MATLRWEYAIVSLERLIDTELNRYGEVGWELLTILEHSRTCVFRRALPAASKPAPAQKGSEQ